jgi:hypothetical protein
VDVAVDGSKLRLRRAEKRRMESERDEPREERRGGKQSASETMRC